MAQSGKCLPCQHEDAGSIPKMHVKKLGIIMHAYNPSARDGSNRQVPRLSGQPSIISEFQAN